MITILHRGTYMLHFLINLQNAVLGGSVQMITILHRGGSGQMITVLHRGGSGQMITILHGGGGSTETPKSDYVIYG